MPAAGLLGAWFFLRYGLPVLLPFLLGAALALAAEPPVRLLHNKLRLPRFLATAIGVTAVFVLLITVGTLLIALVVRNVGRLSQILPELAESVRQGLGSLENWLLQLCKNAPEGIRSVLENTVASLFSGSGNTVAQLAQKLPGLAAGIFSRVAGSALTVATSVLAAFMISARLPQLRRTAAKRIPGVWKERYLPALKALRRGLTGWLIAQLKLSGITFAQLLIGFWLLRIPYGSIWALMVALVDAFPVLGTGTVLIPWGIICLLQGQAVRGAGLLSLYAVVWLMRSILEPRLLGKELGLDPLATLLAVYAGYKLLGLMGMILAPMLAVTTLQLIKAAEK